MDENAARNVLLIRAIEISDPACEVLSQSDREFATREAGKIRSQSEEHGALSGEEEAFLLRRARHLRERLVKRFPAADDAKSFRRASVTFSIGVAAFLLGIATNSLGESNRVNIIAFPLLGMLAWNASVYLFLITEWLHARRHPSRSQSHPLQRAVVALLSPSRILKSRRAPTALAAGIGRYHDDWIALAAPLYFARAKSILHLAAALLALGALAGMYLRGIGFEYLAGWESTFLSEHDLRPLLGFVLGPASLLTGIALPDERQLAALRWSATQPGENAARWIHLWAMTALLGIVVPRVVLAIMAWLKERRLASNLRVPDDLYFRRLLRGGEGGRVRIVPCSYQPAQDVRENVRKSLARVLGERAQVEFDEGAPYGAEEDYLAATAESSAPPADRLLVLFNLATTPEEENHEFLLRGLQRFVTQGRAARDLIALVDESSYRARLAGDSSYAARIGDRRKAWRDLLVPYKHAFVDFREPDLGALETLFDNAKASS
ncbi:MAG: DUF2868 domain-containing protein [Burkholderiales bacterium]